MKIDISSFPDKNKIKKRLIDDQSFKLDFSLNKKFSDKKKEKFYKELSVLLQSGVNLKRAMDILASQMKKKSDKNLINTINSAIIKGKSLTEAMRRTKQFSPYEYYSIKLGEETKNLEKILTELHLFFYRKIQIRRQIITVSTYPVFVISITIAVLVFMLKSVVPMFAGVFKQFGGELPKLTQKIIYISNHFSTILIVVFLIFAIFLTIFFLFRKTDKYRKIMSGFISKIPFFGKLINTIYLARFCQSLSLLLSAKTPLVNSLDLIKKMINYYPIESNIDYIKSEVINGKSFGDSLSKFKTYDKSLVSMVKVAEEVNQLDVMFDRLSKQYSEEVEYKSKVIGVVMEPLIITIIGLIVGVIMISMYLPMFDLSKILNN